MQSFSITLYSKHEPLIHFVIFVVVIIHLVSCLVVKLLSCYTTQHTHVDVDTRPTVLKASGEDVKSISFLEKGTLV